MEGATVVQSSALPLSDFHAAAERIQPLARRTAIVTSRLFDKTAGVETYFKCENLQRGGSFKIRGAANFIAALPTDERKRGIVTFSSGNHAQAVAIAAEHFGVKATIVMPSDAPKAKLKSTEAYSPQIVLYDRLKDDREKIANAIAERDGSVVLPSYNHPWIVAGQGTATLEILDQVTGLDALVVCLGGGGLLSGALCVAKALRPGIRVYGVEPELANDWRLSLDRGERVEIAPPPTIADGLRTSIPGTVTFPIVQSLVDDVLLVSEAEIKEAMRFLLSRTKMLVEPSGAVGAAAVLAGKLPRDVKRAAVILSGGNVDFDLLAAICGEAA